MDAMEINTEFGGKPFKRPVSDLTSEDNVFTMTFQRKFDPDVGKEFQRGETK